MSSIKEQLDAFVRWLNGCDPSSTESPKMPEELRHASHRMASAASNIQGAAQVIRKEHDALNDLVDMMQGRERRHGHGHGNGH